MVYWGELDSETKGLAGKSVSWLPIIGGVIPDETQAMRIRMTVAVIDVSSGRWESFLTQPIADESTSNQHGRVASDQAQVQDLKAKGYDATLDELVSRYRL